MNLMQWSDVMSVRVRELDEHYKRLIWMINALHKGIAEHHENDVVETILDELAEYSVYHFRIEEDYMRRFRYPDFPRHKAEHDAFVRNVTIFRNNLHNFDIAQPFTGMAFLNEWLSSHIIARDIQTCL